VEELRSHWEPGVAGASDAPTMNHPGLGTSPAVSHTREGTTWIPIPLVLIPVTEAGNLSTGTNLSKYPRVENGQDNPCNVIRLIRRFLEFA
jgi:hypothetical protein